MTFAIHPSLAGRNVFVSGGAAGIGADDSRTVTKQSIVVDAGLR